MDVFRCLVGLTAHPSTDILRDILHDARDDILDPSDNRRESTDRVNLVGKFSIAAKPVEFGSSFEISRAKRVDYAAAAENLNVDANFDLVDVNFLIA